MLKPVVENEDVQKLEKAVAPAKTDINDLQKKIKELEEQKKKLEEATKKQEETVKNAALEQKRA